MRLVPAALLLSGGGGAVRPLKPAATPPALLLRSSTSSSSAIRTHGAWASESRPLPPLAEREVVERVRRASAIAWVLAVGALALLLAVPEHAQGFVGAAGGSVKNGMAVSVGEWALGATATDGARGRLLEAGLLIGEAGAAGLAVHIDARDGCGLPRPAGGEAWEATLRPPGGASPVALSNVSDLGDGTYEVHLLTQKTGAYLISVTLHGEHIAGSRFVLKVTSNSAYAPACTGTGRGLRLATAGEAAAFRVCTLDAHGNMCNPPLDAFRVSVRSVHSSIVSSQPG